MSYIKNCIFKITFAILLLITSCEPSLALFGATGTSNVGTDWTNSDKNLYTSGTITTESTLTTDGIILSSNSTVVDTLRTTIPVVGQQIQVTGYSEVGDGGAGPVRIGKTAPIGGLIDNGGSIIKPNGVIGDAIGDGELYWGWEYSGQVNSKWFGIVADGVEDDTAETQILFSSGYKNMVLEGDFLLSSPITISGDNITVDARNSTFTLADETNDNMFEITGDNFTWIGGSIDGNRGNQSGGDWTGIFRGNAAAYLHIIGVTITDAQGDGISLRDCPNAHIEHNRIIDNEVGYAIFVARTASGSVYEGTDIKGPHIHDNYVNRVTFGAATANFTGGIDVRGTTPAGGDEYFGAIVENNEIWQAADVSVSQWVDMSVIYCEGAIISQNKFYGGTIGLTAGIGVKIISGNQFYGCRDLGLEYGGVTDSKISGNIIDGQMVTEAGLYMTSAEGYGATNTIIANNNVKNCTTLCACSRYSTGTKYVGNTFDGSYNNRNGLVVVQEVGLSLIGNTITGGSTNAAIQFDTTDGFVSSGNDYSATNHILSFYSTDAGFAPGDFVFSGDKFTSTNHLAIQNYLVSGVGGPFGLGALFVGCQGEPMRLGNAATVTNFVTHQTGTGSPEGVIASGIGSTWTRTDGDENSTLYVRVSGATGRNGWVAVRDAKEPSGVYQAAGCTNGTTAGKAKTVNTIYYTINGYQNTKAATDDLWDLTGVSTAAGEYKYVFLQLNISGTASIAVGAAGADAGDTPYPNRTASTAVVGIVTIPPSYSGGSLSGFTFNDMTGMWRDDY
jgi:hypothetical protein